MTPREAKSFFAGMDYEPLLATWPDPEFDERMLRDAPGRAGTVLRVLYEQFQEGLTEDTLPWRLWLDELRAHGPDHEAVRFALTGMIFLRHEMRHHIDIFATGIGLHLTSILAGEYLRLSQLTQTSPDSPEETDILVRLKRIREATRMLIGNVQRFDPGDWDIPFIDRKVSWGATVRARRALGNERMGILTLSRDADDARELALSLNALLEVRAVIETAGNVSGRLRAAGASDAEILEARTLLLALSINLARDDYWGVFHSALAATGIRDVADTLGRDGRAGPQLMYATWFALHPDSLPSGPSAVDITAQPPYRFVVALHLLTNIPNDDLVRWSQGNYDWNEIFDQIQERMGGAPFADTLKRRWNEMCALRARLVGHQTLIDGLAVDHLSYLLDACEKGLAARGPNPRWLDGAGWPEQEDPLSVASPLGPSKEVRAAVSILERVRTHIANDAPAPAIRRLAERLVTGPVRQQL